MKLLMKAILPVSLFIIFSSTTFSDKGKIVIEVEDIRNSNGSIRVGIYQEKNYLKDEGLVARVIARIENKQCLLETQNLPYGQYAIVLIHDENDNGEMDYNFMKIPKEGVGFSNNPKLGMSAPKFDETKIKLDAQQKSIKVKMKYF